ncbi:hypothetical protein FRC10_012140 [Ceratobasidium sp. 414]|nr:hypothetical protein FRC10_012140 [Ceratobasidium sp. 414]
MAENYIIIPHEYDDEDLSLRMNRWIKKLNPSFTTSYSVGGWSMSDDTSFYTGGVDYSPFFSRMPSSAANRKVFVDSVSPIIALFVNQGVLVASARSEASRHQQLWGVEVQGVAKVSGIDPGGEESSDKDFVQYDPSTLSTQDIKAQLELYLHGRMPAEAAN